MRPTYYNGGTIIGFWVNGSERLIRVSDGSSLGHGVVLHRDVPQPIFQKGICCGSSVQECQDIQCQMPLMMDSPFVISQVMFFETTLMVTLDYLRVNGDTVLSGEQFQMLPNEINLVIIDGHQIYDNLFIWLRDMVSPWLQLELSAASILESDSDIITISRNSCEVNDFELKLVPSLGDEVGFDAFVLNQNGYVSVTDAELDDESLINYLKGAKNCGDI